MADIGGVGTTQRVQTDYNVLPNAPGQVRTTPASPAEFVPLPQGMAAALGMAIPMMSDSADLVAMVTALKTTIEETSLKTGMEQAQDIKAQKLDVAKERIEKMQEAREKMEESKKSGLAGEIFGWIAGIAMAIAGAILCATGVGGPLGAMLLVGGVTMLVMQTLQSEALGKAVGLDSNMMTAMIDSCVDSMLENGLISEDQKEEMKTVMHAVFTVILTVAAVVAGTLAGGPFMGLAMATQTLSGFFTPENIETMCQDMDPPPTKEQAVWASLGINIGLAVVGIAAGIGSSVQAANGAAKAATKAADVADDMAKLGTQALDKTDDAAKAAALAADKGDELTMVAAKSKEYIGRMVSYVAQGISATATIGQGASGIATGVIRRDSEELRAQGKELEGFFLELQAKFQEQADQLEEIVRRIQENASTVMDILNQRDMTGHKINTI